MNRMITMQMLVDFANYLRSDEKSGNTIDKYMRDIKWFWIFAKEQEVNKAITLEYKTALAENMRSQAPIP